MGETEWRRCRTKKLKVAFYCWAKGYYDPHFKKQFLSMGERDMETIETVKCRIQRRTFPEYETPDFYEAIWLWRDWRIFGFPNSGGMMDQPAKWVDIVRAMQECGDKMKVE